MWLLHAEAVFLGVMLTQGWSQLQRLPVGFKSRGSDGQVCVITLACLVQAILSPGALTHEHGSYTYKQPSVLNGV